jgi:hypothetical protein
VTTPPITSAPSKIAVIMEAVADCLCEQITTDGRPEVCYCGVVPGALAIADLVGNCGDVCGMAWVRLEQMYPAVVAGVPDGTPGNCGKGLAMDIEVGILRCCEAGESDPAELLASTELQLADAETIYRAVRCCPALPNMDTIVAPYVPLGPDGGTVGGTVMVSVMVY